MNTTQEQTPVDVVGILSNAIAISGPTPPSLKTKNVPHKAGKTISSSTSCAKKRSWKKPADKPKRPLSAYNLFFKAERARLISGATSTSSATDDYDANVADAKRKHRKTHGKIGFAEMAQTIAGKWKTLSAKDRRPFEQKAAVEKARYRRELQAWQQVQTEKKPNEPICSDNAVADKVTVPDSPVSSSDAIQVETDEKKSIKKKKKTAAKEPLSLPSSMPFYPMNLKGSPTTANIAPITLQNMGMPLIMPCLAAPMAATSTMPPLSLDVPLTYELVQEDAAVVTPIGSCGNSDVEYDDDAERDILSDVADASLLDDESFGLLPLMHSYPEDLVLPW